MHFFHLVGTYLIVINKLSNNLLLIAYINKSSFEYFKKKIKKSYKLYRIHNIFTKVNILTKKWKT